MENKNSNIESRILICKKCTRSIDILWDIHYKDIRKNDYFICHTCVAHIPELAELIADKSLIAVQNEIVIKRSFQHDKTFKTGNPALDEIPAFAPNGTNFVCLTCNKLAQTLHILEFKCNPYSKLVHHINLVWLSSIIRDNNGDIKEFRIFNPLEN